MRRGRYSLLQRPLLRPDTAWCFRPRRVALRFGNRRKPFPQVVVELACLSRWHPIASRGCSEQSRYDRPGIQDVVRMRFDTSGNYSARLQLCQLRQAVGRLARLGRARGIGWS